MQYTSQRGSRPDPLLTMVSALSPLCLLLLARRKPAAGELTPVPAAVPADQQAAPAWPTPALPIAADDLATPALAVSCTQVDTSPVPGLPVLAGAAQPLLSDLPLLPPQAGGQDEVPLPEAAVQQVTPPGPTPPAASALSIAVLAEQLLAHTVLVSVADRDDPLEGRIAAVTGELLVLVPPEDEEVIYVRLECVTAIRTVSENRERNGDDDDSGSHSGGDEWDEEDDPVQDWDEAGSGVTTSHPYHHPRPAPAQVRAHVPRPGRAAPVALTSDREATAAPTPAAPDAPTAVYLSPRPERWPEAAQVRADDHAAPREDNDISFPVPRAATGLPAGTRASVQFGQPVACIIGPEGYKLVSVYRPGQIA